MKMKYLIALLLFFSQNVWAQTGMLKGIVLNGEDNSILPSASIFINNSTKGTLSDSEGKFSLAGIESANFDLVISYSGFATVSIRITSGNINDYHTIKMTPRKEKMEGISIVAPEKEGWAKWGKFFNECFLGQSDFAAECEIENPKAILFFIDKKRNILSAYSKENLLIRNKALGYVVKYQLEEFDYDFKQKIVSYVGYSSFEDMKPRSASQRNRWLKNREEVYGGSMMHFMRSLYADSVLENGFLINEKIRVTDEDSLFHQIYIPGNVKKQVRTEKDLYTVIVPEIPLFKKEPAYVDLLNIKPFSLQDHAIFDSLSRQKEFYFENYIQVVYKKALARKDYLLFHKLPPLLKINQASDAFLISEQPLVIEKDGSYFNPVNLMSSGYWGWYKMAEMLPADYVASKN